MNKLIIGIIIGLALTSLLVAGYYGFNYYNLKAYNQGVQVGIYNLALEQTKTDNVYFLNSTNGINFKNLNQICNEINK